MSLHHKKKQIGKNLINILDFISKEYKNRVVEGNLDWVDEFNEYSEKNRFLNEVLHEVSKKCEPDEIARILMRNVKVSTVEGYISDIVDREESIRIAKMLLKGNKDSYVGKIVKKIIDLSNKMRVVGGFTLIEIVILFIQLMSKFSKRFLDVDFRRIILIKKNQREARRINSRSFELWMKAKLNERSDLGWFFANIWHGKKASIPDWLRKKSLMKWEL